MNAGRTMYAMARSAVVPFAWRGFKPHMAFTVLRCCISICSYSSSGLIGSASNMDNFMWIFDVVIKSG